MKKICVLLMMCGLSSVSFAQVQSDLNLDTSNVFKSNEKSSDSLLREISKKQMLLEIRKIEKEIEKLEKPEVTEKEKEVKAPPQDPVIYPASQQAQQMQMQMQMQAAASQPKASNVVVFSVLGLGDKLQAKVGIDNRGGYIVSKGDTLPNGAKVINVTYDYIVISKNKNAKTGEKIYVTGAPSVSNDVAPPPPQNANGSSVVPMGMPVGTPNLNTFGSVSTPAVPNANVNVGNTNVSTSSPGQAPMPDVKGGFMSKIGG